VLDGDTVSQAFGLVNPVAGIVVKALIEVAGAAREVETQRQVTWLLTRQRLNGKSVLAQITRAMWLTGRPPASESSSEALGNQTSL
jgi:hypothetical protein